MDSIDSQHFRLRGLGGYRIMVGAAAGGLVPIGLGRDSAMGIRDHRTDSEGTAALRANLDGVVDVLAGVVVFHSDSPFVVVGGLVVDGGL